MRNIPSRIFALGVALVLAFVASPVSAQRTWAGAGFNDTHGHLLLHDGGVGPAKWRWELGGVSHSGFVPLPTNESASVALINNVFLVSGNGWLVEIVIDVSTGIPQANATQILVPGMDLLSLSYSSAGSMLFAIDGSSESLVATSYLPGAGIVGPWQVVATETQCSALGMAEVLDLGDYPGGVGVNIRAVDPFDSIRFEVVLGQGGWTVTDLSDGSSPVALPATWLVSDYPALSVDTTNYELWIGGGSGLFFIVDQNGGVVFVATHGGNPQGEVFDIPVASLVYGQEYQVIDAAQQGVLPSVPFQVKNVWEKASVLTGITSERLGFRWDFPAVGTDFLSWQLHWDGVSPPQSTWLLTMVIGAWDYGLNPSVPLGSVDVLGTVHGDLGTQFATWDTNGRLVFSWDMDLNNPVFVGLKVAAQGVGITPTSEFFVSDIVGVVLQ